MYKYALNSKPLIRWELVKRYGTLALKRPELISRNKN